MPYKREPLKLKEICIDNISANIDNFWIKKNEGFTRIFEMKRLPKYILGSPFEGLLDDLIFMILKKIFKLKELKSQHFIILLHYRIRKIDLSFVTHKKAALVNTYLSHFIGNMCFNVTELNLRCQTELTQKDLKRILVSMTNLKHLDLSHTKADVECIRVMESNKLKLEYLNLENCKLIFEYCIEIIIEIISETIQDFNIQNIFQRISEELIEKILLTCNNLRHFQVNNLADVIHKLHIKSIFNEYNNQELLLKIRSVYIDPEINLKQDHMNSIAESCPELKSLIINCAGSRNCLENLVNFKFLTELLISNLNSLLTHSFGGSLIEVLRTSFGKQLKSLHLSHITGVNLRSIAKYCPNLIKLNVDLLNYYEPAVDNFYEIDINNNQKNIQDPIIESLRHLSVKNNLHTVDQIHKNLDIFQDDLHLLLSNGKVEYLELSNFNDLNDEFFLSLISLDSKRNIYLHVNIQKLILEEINKITFKFVHEYLFNGIKNSLKYLNLLKCKSISSSDYLRLKNMVKYENENCEIYWK